MVGMAQIVAQPDQAPIPVPPSGLAQPRPPVPKPQLGGGMSPKSFFGGSDQAHENALKLAAAEQSRPVIHGLAGHVKQRWHLAWSAKQELERRMIRNRKAFNGEYDEAVLRVLMRDGSPVVHMNVTQTKVRATVSWMGPSIREGEKPWGLMPTPIPELPPGVMDGILAELQERAAMHFQQMGVEPSLEAMSAMSAQMRDEAFRTAKEMAETKMERAELELDDELSEGGFYKALEMILMDLGIYPFAALKGPVKRRRRVQKWDDESKEMRVTEEIRNEWERVDPFMLYWDPASKDINDGFVIEKHRLSRMNLQAMIGVPGYSDNAIRAVLQNAPANFMAGGSANVGMAPNAMAIAAVQGRNTAYEHWSNEFIEAIQLWDTIPGELLRQWGMSPQDVPDPGLAYPGRDLDGRRHCHQGRPQLRPRGAEKLFRHQLRQAPG